MGFLRKYFGKEKEISSPERFLVEHERFGNCVFERGKDGDLVRLVEGISRIPFGKYEDVELDMEVPEGRIGEAFQCLGHVYDGQEKFINKFYEGIRSFCEEWEETDSRGNDITMETVEKNGSLFRIQVRESWRGNLIVALRGMMSDDAGKDLLGCHSVIAEINCETDEVEYDLEG
ncbi:MAG: hypothetical protein HFI63_00245 [Lachnospiraceae bacterium]|nr:hypothetical protein [Lachnospiraceae bacterium]